VTVAVVNHAHSCQQFLHYGLLVYVGPIGLGFRVFTSDKVGGKCFCPCMSVYLSVSKITQKCMRGFG